MKTLASLPTDGSLVKIGDGNDARRVSLFGGYFTDAQGSHPAAAVPKSPPPESRASSSASSASYLLCGLSGGLLNAAELTVRSENGQLLMRQGPVKTMYGYEVAFAGDLAAECNRQLSSMTANSMTANSGIRATNVAYGDNEALRGVPVHADIIVSDPFAFCSDPRAQQTVVGRITASTNQQGVSDKVSKCTPKSGPNKSNAESDSHRKLNRRSQSQSNVELEFTVFTPPAGLATVCQKLAAPLPQVQSSLGQNQWGQILRLSTPLSDRRTDLSTTGGQNTASMPTNSDAANQRGLANPLDNILGKSFLGEGSGRLQSSPVMTASVMALGIAFFVAMGFVANHRLVAWSRRQAALLPVDGQE